MNKKDEFVSIPKLKNEIFHTKKAKQEYLESLNDFEKKNDRLVLYDLAKQLKNAREKAGITQEDLAKRMNTNKGNISRIEHGRQNLSVSSIVKIARALERPVRIEIM